MTGGEREFTNSYSFMLLNVGPYVTQRVMEARSEGSPCLRSLCSVLVAQPQACTRGIHGVSSCHMWLLVEACWDHLWFWFCYPMYWLFDQQAINIFIHVIAKNGEKTALRIESCVILTDSSQITNSLGCCHPFTISCLQRKIWKIYVKSLDKMQIHNNCHISLI